jgi:hypothetical protein
MSRSFEESPPESVSGGRQRNLEWRYIVLSVGASEYRNGQITGLGCQRSDPVAQG